MITIEAREQGAAFLSIFHSCTHFPNMMRDERRDYGGITLGWTVKSTPLPLKAPANAKLRATAVFGLAVSALLETKPSK